MEALRNWLEHPATKGLDLDSPECTELRQKIIKSNPYLLHIYQTWYRLHRKVIPTVVELSGKSVLEIGSGGGFFEEYMGEGEKVITSDIIPLDGVAKTIDAQELDLEFPAESLRAITMINVLHHIPDVSKFFLAASKTLDSGGVLSLVEPWPTPWSRFVFANLHHEPFDINRPDWGFDSVGPLSGANGAIPWIVFNRDKEVFTEKHSELEIVSVRPMMPFLYLVSGGVSMKQLQPTFLLSFWKAFDTLTRPLHNMSAMFAHIVVRKK